MFFFCTEGKEAEECERDELGYRCLVNAEGASAFFTKPFDNEEFLTAVRMALAAVD